MALWDKIRKGAEDGLESFRKETSGIVDKLEEQMDKVKKDAAELVGKVEENVDKLKVQERASDIIADLKESTDKAKGGIIFATDRAVDTAKVARLRLTLGDLEKKIEKNFTELGGRVYDLRSENKTPSEVIKNTRVKELLEEIKGYEKEINQAESKIKKLQ